MRMWRILFGWSFNQTLPHAPTHYFKDINFMGLVKLHLLLGFYSKSIFFFVFLAITQVCITFSVLIGALS